MSSSDEGYNGVEGQLLSVESIAEPTEVDTTDVLTAAEVELPTGPG